MIFHHTAKFKDIEHTFHSEVNFPNGKEKDIEANKDLIINSLLASMSFSLPLGKFTSLWKVCSISLNFAVWWNIITIYF